MVWLCHQLYLFSFCLFLGLAKPSNLTFTEAGIPQGLGFCDPFFSVVIFNALALTDMSMPRGYMCLCLASLELLSSTSIIPPPTRSLPSPTCQFQPWSSCPRVIQLWRALVSFIQPQPQDPTSPLFNPQLWICPPSCSSTAVSWFCCISTVIRFPPGPLPSLLTPPWGYWGAIEFLTEYFVGIIPPF